MGSINAEDFLSFEGDFSVECDDEQGKINLNYFRDVEGEINSTTGSNAYEAHKKLIQNLLTQESFEKILENKKDDIKKIVNNIADWVDSNDRINEAPGIAGGYEDSEYDKSDYKVKNGRFLSIAELLLVARIGDDLYNALLPHVTIYGDNKLNPCIASDDMVISFVMRYSEEEENIPVLSSDKDERVQKILDGVSEACVNPSPQTNDIATAIVDALDVAENEAGNAKSNIATEMAKQLTTTNRFYGLNLTGSVGDISMRIKAVLDTDGAMNSWKLLYYRVE